MDTCGMRIKALREAAGLTQEQLGQKICSSGVTIMRYERGQRQPRMEQLSKLSDALAMPVSFFQSSAPFEDLDFLESFKSVILLSLEANGFFSWNNRVLSEIGDYEYWRCISDHIVSIVRTPKNTLSIQYKEGIPETSEKAKFAVAKVDLDFDAVIEKFQSQKQLVNAYQVLNGLSTLNAAGQQKVVERVEELKEIAKYRL